MAMTNAERQKKFRERNIGLKGKNFRLQAIIDLKTFSELERLKHRLQKSKQEIISQAIHELAVKLACDVEDWEKEYN